MKTILITGAAGAGKSTVSEELAKHFERSAIVSVDPLRHMVKSGHVRPWPKTLEGEAQLALSARNACALANNFSDAGFDVIIDDVVSAKERLDLYIELLHKKPSIFLMFSNKEVLTHRDLSRTPENQMKDRALELHDRFTKRVKEENRWHVIDSSAQDVSETVEQILKSIKQIT